MAYNECEFHDKAIKMSVS